MAKVNGITEVEAAHSLMSDFSLAATFEAFCRSNRVPRSYARDELDPDQWPARLAEIMSEQDALQQGAMMTTLLCKEYLTDGSHVLLGGLKGRADLNGLSGVIVGQQVNGRIPVQLQIAETTVVRVQIQNIRPLPQDYEAEEPHRPRHTVRGVFDPGDAFGYVYTVGVTAPTEASVMEPTPALLGVELFAAKVLRAKGEAVCKLMNFLVRRMEEGHHVGHGQTVQSHGLAIALRRLDPQQRAAAKDEYDLFLPDGAGLLQLEPMFPSRDADAWGRMREGAVVSAKA